MEDAVAEAYPASWVWAFDAHAHLSWSGGVALVRIWIANVDCMAGISTTLFSMGQRDVKI